MSLRLFWDASPDILAEGNNTVFSNSRYLSDFEELSLLRTEPLSHVQISKEVGKLVLVCVGNLLTTYPHEMQFKTQGQVFNLKGSLNKLHKMTLEHKSHVGSMFSLTCFKCMLVVQAITIYVIVN